MSRGGGSVRSTGAGSCDGPHHGEFVADHAADVVRRPVARLHVLCVELPQVGPVLATPVGVAVQVEEHGLRGRAPDRLQFLPVEARFASR